MEHAGEQNFPRKHLPREMKIMHYIYVLRSLKDGWLYVGRTKDLAQRFKEHMAGGVLSTRNRRPMRFLYAEMCHNIKDATRRERYLKTAWGKRYLKNRLKNDET